MTVAWFAVKKERYFYVISLAPYTQLLVILSLPLNNISRIFLHLLVPKYPKTAIKTTVNIAINTIDKFGPISYIFVTVL